MFQKEYHVHVDSQAEAGGQVTITLPELVENIPISCTGQFVFSSTLVGDSGLDAGWIVIEEGNPEVVVYPDQKSVKALTVNKFVLVTIKAAYKLADGTVATSADLSFGIFLEVTTGHREAPSGDG